jgi:secreted trypsin-like serine protease
MLPILLFGYTTAIIGGTSCTKSEQPWLVSLQVNGQHSCGGILINPTTVVTAAHCTEPLQTQSMGIMPKIANIPKTNTAGPGILNGNNKFFPVNIPELLMFPNSNPSAIPQMFPRPFGMAVPKGQFTLSVLANRNNLDLTTEEEGGFEFTVGELFTHPKYVENPNFVNDVAIWKVKVVSGDISKIPSVTLDDGTYSKPGTNLTAAGWGMTSARGKMSKQLLKITTPVSDTNECKEIYKELEKSPGKDRNGEQTTFLPPGYDPVTSICAGDMQGVRSICHGDSGGPLYAMNNNEAVLVGLSSHANGFDCATKGVPDIYARISSTSINQFIRKHM